MLSCGCDFEGHSWSRTRTARKAHVCGECGKEIKPGDDYEFHSIASEGTLQNFKTCEACHDLAVSMMDMGFCWYWGSLKEMHQEYLELYNPPKINLSRIA